MKSKVHFSPYCTIMTMVVLAALGVAVATSWNHAEFPVVCIITIASAFTGLYYCPVSVSADTEGVKIHRLLSGTKSFRYSDIRSVDSCYPSAGGIRLCGSGGFFGYWGYFSDILIGQYFGYYADRSQCFCIKLKNDRQYVISCQDHTLMMKAIQEHLTHRQ